MLIHLGISTEVFFNYSLSWILLISKTIDLVIYCFDIGVNQPFLMHDQTGIAEHCLSILFDCAYSIHSCLFIPLIYLSLRPNLITWISQPYKAAKILSIICRDFCRLNLYWGSISFLHYTKLFYSFRNAPPPGSKVVICGYLFEWVVVNFKGHTRNWASFLILIELNSNMIFQSSKFHFVFLIPLANILPSPPSPLTHIWPCPFQWNYGSIEQWWNSFF